MKGPSSPDPVALHSRAELESLLLVERDRAQERVRALTASFDEMVAYSAGSPPDDEHDPEGATIGWEREQLAAVRDQAHHQIAELDAALKRVRSGSYGICERCDRAIEPGRLAARPASRHCLGCAAQRGPGPTRAP